MRAACVVHGLLSFPFTALELSSSADEEQVADVFVRINSKGKSVMHSVQVCASFQDKAFPNPLYSLKPILALLMLTKG